MAKQKKAKSFVYYDTIWKGVGGGLSNPGESRLCKVGKHKVLLTRSERLNRYGNPVHTASLVRGGRTVGYSAKSSGSATMVGTRKTARSNERFVGSLRTKTKRSSLSTRDSLRGFPLRGWWSY